MVLTILFAIFFKHNEVTEKEKEYLKADFQQKHKQ